MSGKRPSLAESMRAVAAEAPPPAAPVTQPPAPEPSAAADMRPKAFYAATRVGKKKATATLSEAAHRQLKKLAVDKGGIEKLMTEALNDLFRKYDLPPIA